MAVQEDQHIPLAWRLNAQSLEPAFDLKVWLVVLSHRLSIRLEPAVVDRKPLAGPHNLFY